MIEFFIGTVMSVGGKGGLVARVRIDDLGSVVAATVGSPVVMPLAGSRVLCLRAHNYPWVIVQTLLAPCYQDIDGEPVVVSDPPKSAQILASRPAEPGDAYYTLSAVRWFGLVLKAAYTATLTAGERCRIILNGPLRFITAIARRFDFQALGWRFIVGPSKVDETGVAEGTLAVMSMDSAGERAVNVEFGNRSAGDGLDSQIYGVNISIQGGSLVITSGDTIIRLGADVISLTAKDTDVTVSEDNVAVKSMLKVTSEINMEDDTRTVSLKMVNGVLTVSGPVLFGAEGAVLEKILPVVEVIRVALMEHTHAGPTVGPYVGTMPPSVDMENTTRYGG